MRAVVTRVTARTAHEADKKFGLDDIAQPNQKNLIARKSAVLFHFSNPI